MIAITIIKELSVGEEWIVLNRNFAIVQVAANAFLLAVLLGVSFVYGWNVIQSYRNGMTWTQRRAFVVRVRFSVCDTVKLSCVLFAVQRIAVRWQ